MASLPAVNGTVGTIIGVTGWHDGGVEPSTFRVFADSHKFHCDAENLELATAQPLSIFWCVAIILAAAAAIVAALIASGYGGFFASPAFRAMLRLSDAPTAVPDNLQTQRDWPPP